LFLSEEEETAVVGSTLRSLERERKREGEKTKLANVVEILFFFSVFGFRLFFLPKQARRGEKCFFSLFRIGLRRGEKEKQRKEKEREQRELVEFGEREIKKRERKEKNKLRERERRAAPSKNRGSVFFHLFPILTCYYCASHTF